MVTERRDMFGRAYRHLRDGLAAGTWEPATQILATEIAERLRSSATPVREAMSRLVGEGLLDDHRGQGYFVPQRQSQDVADLFALDHHLVDTSMLHLDAPAAALAQRASDLDAALATARGAQDSGSSVALADIGATICLSVASWSRSRIRAFALQRSVNMLARVRAFEPRIIPDLAAELRSLLVLIGTDDRSGLRAAPADYHARRRAVAADLCFLAYEAQPRR